MTRYWDNWAESLELVMRFISCRNWSSVGVVAIVGIFSMPVRGKRTCFVACAVTRCECVRLLVRESRKSDADAGWMWSVRGGGGPLLAFFDGRFSDRDKGDSDQQ